MTIEQRNQMALENDGLIHAAAKKYKNLAPYEDLYQEGFIALLRACEKYDENSGTKFATYASVAIMNALKRFVIGDAAIPVPEYMNQQMLAVTSVIQTLENEGVVPTKELVAERMGVEISVAAQLMEYYGKRIVSSMDSVIQETGDSFGDLMSDSGPSVEEQIERDQDKYILYKAIAQVYGEKYAQVVMYYNGIGTDSHTLEETGQMFGLTKERVRQIVAQVEGKNLKNEKAMEKHRELKKYLRDAV